MATSVTGFGKISPIYQNFEGLFSICEFFELTLANVFYLWCYWAIFIIFNEQILRNLATWSHWRQLCHIDCPGRTLLMIELQLAATCTAWHTFRGFMTRQLPPFDISQSEIERKIKRYKENQRERNRKKGNIIKKDTRNRNKKERKNHKTKEMLGKD